MSNYHLWNEDALEPRVGWVGELVGHRFCVSGCSPRVGDWLLIRDEIDALVLRNDEGLLDCFPFFRLRPNPGDFVTIIGSVTEVANGELYGQALVRLGELNPTLDTDEGS